MTRTKEGIMEAITKIEQVIGLQEKQRRNYYQLKLSLQQEYHLLEDEFWLDKVTTGEKINEFHKFVKVYAEAFGKAYTLSRYDWIDSQRLQWKKKKGLVK